MYVFVYSNICMYTSTFFNSQRNSSVGGCVSDRLINRVMFHVLILVKVRLYLYVHKLHFINYIEVHNTVYLLEIVCITRNICICL